MRRHRLKMTCKGFTLLEIIIVLFLMVLIMGLSAVFFSNFLPSVKFNATGREMTAMIRQARSLARINGVNQTFIIDLDNKTYGITGMAEKRISPDYLIKVIDPFSGEITQGKYSIVFHPAGTMGGGTIILSGRKRVLRIDLDPIMGAELNKEEH
jgi:general secretion pathway protein H